jgi:class 3 adenylate cyclase
VKDRSIRAAGRLSLVAQDENPPYKYVTVEGPVVANDEPPTREQALRIAGRYWPQDQATAYVDSALGEKSILVPHRREICYVFVDLRGFTTFTDSAEPEEVESVLRQYHDAMGVVVTEFGGTVDRFAGDGILIFFNDPLPIDEPGKQAAKMALTMQDRFVPLRERWLKVGHDLALGIGIAQGYATLGAFGFEGRWDYSAIGGVVNLASRLCDEARSGQVLIDRRTRAALGDAAEVEPLGPLTLKGYSQPVAAFVLKRL